MIRLPGSGRRARREAAAWVARLGGGAGESDHAAFRAWYAADRRNAEAYDRMAAIWSASGQLRMSGTEPREPAPTGSRGLVLAIAASVVVAIGVFALLLSGPVSGDGFPRISYATAPGELREVGLPDGSRVMLDAQSRIETAFSPAERRLLLREGRARFSVSHEARPFIVQAGDDLIKATGGVFDVSMLSGRLSVVLIEGSVEIDGADGSGAAANRRLSAGQRLVARDGGESLVGAAAPGDTSWVSRRLVFDEAPLGEVVETVNRYSRTQIRLGDDGIRRLRITGTYRAGDSAGLARALAAAFGLELSNDADGQLTLRRRAPSH